MNGEQRDLYVVHPTWAEASTTGDRLQYDYNNRMYLSTVDAIDTSRYFRANLLGGGVQYDVDLSKAGCGCVTALYNVLMPAVDN